MSPTPPPTDDAATLLVARLKTLEEHLQLAGWHSDYPESVHHAITLIETQRRELGALPSEITTESDRRKAMAEIEPLLDVSQALPANDPAIRRLKLLACLVEGHEIKTMELPALRTRLADAERELLVAREDGRRIERGAALISKERARQLSKGDWTPEHDDLHTAGDLRVQAAILACEGTDASVSDALDRAPWNIKERDDVLRLAIAGALIAAEIDRLDRAATPPPPVTTNDTAKEGA